MHRDFHHIHNQFLQILTQSGLIGLSIFLTIFYMIFKIPLKNKEYQNIKYIYLTVLFFSFMTEVVFPHQFSMTLFALIIGLLLAQQRIENEV
jgi:O-antigen ligase